MTDNEQKAREYFRQLKTYYTNLVIYGAVLFICLIVWASTGGSFWPIWVLLALGASAFVQGLKLGIFPMLKDLFPFLRPDWEEKRLKELFEEESHQNYHVSSNPPQTTHQSSTPTPKFTHSSHDYTGVKKDPSDDQGA